MALINYFTEDVAFPSVIKKTVATRGLKLLASHHHSSISGINYIFCSDDYLLDINKSYLNHDYFTDIITFPYQQGSILEGDIFISIDRVADNAAKAQVTQLQEYYRVMAHGILHLIGFKDKTKSEIKAMRAAEEDAIQLLTSLS